MAINWVQGAGLYVGGSSITITITGVTAGNCLVVSFGMWRSFAVSQVFPPISDNQGNVWYPACMSPVQLNSGDTTSYQVITYVALDVSGGNTTILIGAGSSGQMTILVDEFSGVSHVKALDKFSYASTEFGSGVPSIASGNITTVSGEHLYSCGFCNGNSESISSSVGFTQRTYVTGTYLTSSSFDKSASAGTDSNTITASPTPGTVHVTLLALSPTPVSNPIVQWTCNSAASITVSHVDTVYPFQNTAGNLLIAVAQLYEVTDAVVSDSQGNIWNTVYTSPTGTNDTIVMAYAVNCKPGGNTVTITTAGGGTDDYIGIIIAEYESVSGFTASSKSVAIPPLSSSVDTGNVGVSSPPSLLVSCFMNASPPTAGVAVPLGSRRIALSNSGFFNSQNMVLELADQIKNAPGSYDDIFDISTGSGYLHAGILGFTLPTPPPPVILSPHVFSVLYPAPPQVAHISHLVYDIHGEAWYADKFADSEHIMHYTVPQHDPTAETFVLAGASTGEVLVETLGTDDDGKPIACNVVTRESNPGAWAYAWFENPGVDLLPTFNVPMTVKAVSLGAQVGAPTTVPDSLTRITQQIIDIGGGQPLKSLGLQFLWSQTYLSGEVLPVTLYMMQWLAVAYPEPILNQRTKGTSHGLRGFQHLYMGQLAYVAPNAPVTITLNFDQPGGSGNTATILLPATAVPHSPDPIKQMFKIPPNKWKIASYDISSSAPFFLWPEDCEMWLKEWGSESQYAVFRPWGGAEGGPIA